MITAFQRSAFQDNAFQIGVTVGSGGFRLPYAYSFLREEAERKKREEEEAALAAVVAPELEVVTALAAPIVTELTPPQVTLVARAAPRDELHDFLQLMIKLAQSEDEIA